MRKCPDCGGKLDIDSCDYFEVVCYQCGYFVEEKFRTEAAADAYIEGSE